MQPPVNQSCTSRKQTGNLQGFIDVPYLPARMSNKGKTLQSGGGEGNCSLFGGAIRYVDKTGYIKVFPQHILEHSLAFGVLPM